MKLKKFNEMNFESELQRYIKGKVDYQPLLNIFMTNRGKDYYDELGRYILNIFDDKLPKELEFCKHQRNKVYSFVAIRFLTSVLSPEILKNLFGEPLLHNEFGEGLYDEDDEDVKSEFDYASYFVTINGTKLHIGYDNRGTNIEIDETVASKAFETIKKLIDMVKTNLIK